MKDIYKQLKLLLTETVRDSRLVGRTAVIGSQARQKKRGYHLYGKKKASIMGLSARQTYFAGIIQQKDFVGLYLMSIYSHPQTLRLIKSEKLKKSLKGKSCFNITVADSQMLRDLKKLFSAGLTLYKKEGWV